MYSDTRRRGDRQGHTRAHICEKSLMPLARTAPSPASPFHRIWSIKASSVMVLRGEYPPQPQTTISNSKYVTQILRDLPCVTARSEPREPPGIW